MLAFEGSLRAVELIVCAEQLGHPRPFHTDEIVTYDVMLSQEVLMKSSKLIDAAILGW
jgi:hypothetical protein